MIDVLAGFIQELRRAGLPVSLTENLDATAAVTHVPLEDREAFRYALAATLVKSSAHWKTFETVFDVYFSTGDAQRPLEVAGPADDGGAREEPSPEDLAEMLYLALRRADQETLRAIARRAVAHHAGMEPGRRAGSSYYLYRTLRRLDLEGMLERLLAEVQVDAGDGFTALDERLAREEYASRAEEFRRQVEAEILRRLVADRGAGPVARTLRRPLPEEIDFMHVSGEELAMLRRAVHPLARRLAVRLARKRRHRRRGPLDFRNTIRHSLSYGGVPGEPKFRHPRPSRPDIIVIADVSGSVAAFARFTLQFVYAISAQFSKVRSFVFIDGIDEVTRFFQGQEDVAAAVHRVETEADVVWLDGHSDYGHALEAFWDRWGQEVGSRSSLILLGDARNNYHASGAWVLKAVRERARHLYWLNPEPRSYWDTGDSIASEYAGYCDGVFECRNLKQLERFVEHLA